MLEKNINDFIIKRCEAALMESREYLEKEQSGAVSQDELQALSEVLCYKQCLKDVLAICLIYGPKLFN